jgi:hypothetical protein
MFSFQNGQIVSVPPLPQYLNLSADFKLFYHCHKAIASGYILPTRPGEIECQSIMLPDVGKTGAN